MTRFNVDFDGVMDRLEELERENHRLIAERDARHQQVVWRNARIDELQTMIDAMRPVVERAAIMADNYRNCPDCHAWRRINDRYQDITQHAPSCAIGQARAFVAAHPATAAAGEGEGEGED